jgi:hypothetical protein
MISSAEPEEGSLKVVTGLASPDRFPNQVSFGIRQKKSLRGPQTPPPVQPPAFFPNRLAIKDNLPAVPERRNPGSWTDTRL